MRIGILPHLVLRLVVSLFMIIHSLVMLLSYESFLKLIRDSIGSDSLLSNGFFLTVVSLIPFIEFAVGLMILVRVFYKKAIIVCTLILLLHLLPGFSPSRGLDYFFTTLSFVLSLVLTYAILTKQEPSRNKLKQL